MVVTLNDLNRVAIILRYLRVWWLWKTTTSRWLKLHLYCDCLWQSCAIRNLKFWWYTIHKLQPQTRCSFLILPMKTDPLPSFQESTRATLHGHLGNSWALVIIYMLVAYCKAVTDWLLVLCFESSPMNHDIALGQLVVNVSTSYAPSMLPYR